MIRADLTKSAALFVTSATLVAALASGAAVAQDSSIGYWKDNSGKVVRSGTNLCWRAGYWTPAMATAECDPDLVPKPAAKPPAAPAAAPAPAAPGVTPAAPAPARAPAPAPAETPKPPAKPAAAPVTQKVTLSSDVLFDFDKAIVKPEGKIKLDDLVGKLKAVNLEVIIAIGHTDSVGSNAYNQKLSVRRANAVKAYFVSRGVPANRIYTEGKGETSPVATNKTKEGRQ
ncbi:MAG: OmpA family protein, partial [Betaproteobacteria bacterium]|nr:OmpA family protein [Betaproteobacteria bacterium]